MYQAVEQNGASRKTRRDGLRIAMLAPPWLPVPPPAYGGIESVVHLLCEGLIDAGHDVTLFAPPGSESRACLCTPLDGPHPDEIGASVHEADHVGCCLDSIFEATVNKQPFDVVHDHCGFMALAAAPVFPCPVVHTAHGPFTEDVLPFYRRHVHKATIVGLSRAQLDAAPLPPGAGHVVPNPLDARCWPFRQDKSDYLLWIGRMHPDKGAHRAIEVARRAGERLVLGGPVQPGQEEFFATEVEPHVDGAMVRYLGEVGSDEKADLFACARALLMPIRWPEPFGMVMIEALACGTPVIAFCEGSAPEIVDHGRTGFLAADEDEMATYVSEVDGIDPCECRREVLDRWDAPRVARMYEDVYRSAIARTAGDVGQQPLAAVH